MLAEEQIEHFRTFGFLVLPGALDGVTLGGLIEEVDAAVAAVGPRDTETGGITGDYIPAGDRQASAELVQRFQPLAEQLLGREVFPVAAHEILLLGEAWWHVDVGPDVSALKVAVCLETLDARNGALRDRRQWSVEYFAFPANERERAELKRLGPEWREEPESGPIHARDVERLRKGGLL